MPTNLRFFFVLSHWRLYFIVCLCAALNSSCLLFKTKIPAPVVISVDDTTIVPTFLLNGAFTKYTGNVNHEAVLAAFWKGFIEEAANTSNVTVVHNVDTCQIHVKLQQLIFTETASPKTMTNPSDPNSSKTFTLYEVQAEVVINYDDNKKGIQLSEIKARKHKAEKLTNRRSFFDVITGANKDQSNYRIKELNNDICVQYAERLGHRIWVPMARRLKRKGR
jgi:hypothetical protein